MEHGESRGSYSASPNTDPSPRKMRRQIKKAEEFDRGERILGKAETRAADIENIFAEAQGMVAQPNHYDPRNQSPEQEPDAETDGTTADKLVDEPFIPESGRQTPIPPNDDYAYDPDKLGQAFEKRNHLQPPKPEKEDKE